MISINVLQYYLFCDQSITRQGRKHFRHNCLEQGNNGLVFRVLVVLVQKLILSDKS